MPFDGYTNPQIYSALDKQAHRPGDPDQLGNVSNEERELMDRCWNYEPDSRPSCEEIYGSVVDLVGEPDDLKGRDVALWKIANRRGSAMTVNHVNVHRILRGIQVPVDDEYPEL